MHYFPVCFPIRVCSFPTLSALPVSQLLSYRLFAALSVTRVRRDFWSDLQTPRCPRQAGWLPHCSGVFQMAALSRTHFFASPASSLLTHFFSPFSFIFPIPKGLGNGAMQKQPPHHETISDSDSLTNYLHVLVYHLVNPCSTVHLLPPLFKHYMQVTHVTSRLLTSSCFLVHLGFIFFIIMFFIFCF